MPLRLLLIALLLIGFVGGTLAQEPTGTEPGLEHSRQVIHERDVVPDTTSPWRYYPIAVGNRWEYYRTYSAFRSVESIMRDTIIAETHYYLFRFELRFPTGSLRNSYEVPIRFDTTAAIVVMRPTVDGPDEPFQRFAPLFDCPFDIDFGSVCVSAENWHVSGGYDVPVIIGGPPTGSHPDTVITSFKRYWSDTHGDEQVLDFAAGIGFTEWYEDEGGGRQILYYARINGVEYGESQFPVGSEPDASGPRLLTFEVYPNPTTGNVNTAISFSQPAHVRIEVFDVLGRRLAVLSDGTYEAGEHGIQFETGHLPSGLYLVRAELMPDSGVPHVFARRVTVVR